MTDDIVPTSPEQTPVEQQVDEDGLTPSERKARTLAGLRFFLKFECPACFTELDYRANARSHLDTRFLFCECGWEKEVPLPSRFVNYDKQAGGFATKWGAKKKSRCIRITDEAWYFLNELALEYGVNRADLIECWSRALQSDAITANALEIQIGKLVPMEIRKPRPFDAVLSPRSPAAQRAKRQLAPPPPEV